MHMTKPALTGCGPFGASKGLAEVALGHLQATFPARQHHPGPEHWHALQCLLQSMQDMADGTATPNVHLASLDPGIGKSSSIVAFARALVASHEYRDTGMVICVGQIAEATALAEDMTAAGIRASLAVATSDQEANQISGSLPQDAQVLIITKQRVEIETRRHHSFGAVTAFQYRGAVRAVRVWDEAWLPGVTITLNRRALGGLTEAAERINPAFADALERMSDDLRALSHGDTYEVPEWSTFNVTEPELLTALAGNGPKTRPGQAEAACSVFLLSGRTIRVAHENGGHEDTRRVLVNYRDTLPEDLRPLLVLDASIRVRQTYTWAQEWRDARRLPDAVRDYSPLNVHLWRESGSKSGFHAKGQTLVQGIAATIYGKKTEDWLVVVHKERPNSYGNVETRIRALLPEEVNQRVRFLTWGRHMATNEFRDVPNVILAGTLFMNDSHYVALTHLAQNQPTSRPEGFASEEEVNKTRMGEHRNLIFQAACRGTIRKSDGDGCSPMDLYIIASSISAIPTRANIHTMFPGAGLKVWSPVEPPLKGNALTISRVVKDLVVAERLSLTAEPMTYRQIYTEVCQQTTGKVMTWMTFGKAVKSPAWSRWIASQNLIADHVPNGKRAPQRVLRLARDGEQPDWEDEM